MMADKSSKIPGGLAEEKFRVPLNFVTKTDKRKTENQRLCSISSQINWTSIKVKYLSETGKISRTGSQLLILKMYTLLLNNICYFQTHIWKISIQIIVMLHLSKQIQFCERFLTFLRVNIISYYIVAKSFIDVKVGILVWFDLLGFYGISNMVGYLMPNHVYIYITWVSWWNGYRRRKWTRRHEFKSWTTLIAFHIALIPLGKVWIQLFSLQLWVDSRAESCSSALVRQLV